jgi:hypothetical protein
MGAGSFGSGVLAPIRTKAIRIIYIMEPKDIIEEERDAAWAWRDKTLFQWLTTKR